MINIILASIATFAISLIAVPIFTLVYMFTIGFLTSIAENKTFKDIVIVVMQLLTYLTADFCGLALGIKILKNQNNESYYPLLIAIVIFSSISYFIKRFTFYTKEAETLNIRQKVLNIIGTLLASGIAVKLFIY
ncbi:MAG: hypothetical protein KJ550_07870 [Proteobacteria bacterium]|nr:hypothetical protein [Desulfobacteraceae bacterium]MBU4013368.1 hypothetical protein [Pseudomonadota bacterium]MBU4068509.1 hypothetical protein [Pseudomonadota bacterium]MBU4099955.1 hypothetical protein [Pseudomonadota bacterium]